MLWSHGASGFTGEMLSRSFPVAARSSQWGSTATIGVEIWSSYPLVNIQKAIEHCHFIVDLPIKHGGSFHSYVNVYQWVPVGSNQLFGRLELNCPMYNIKASILLVLGWWYFQPRPNCLIAQKTTSTSYCGIVRVSLWFWFAPLMRWSTWSHDQVSNPKVVWAHAVWITEPFGSWHQLTMFFPGIPQFRFGPCHLDHPLMDPSLRSGQNGDLGLVLGCRFSACGHLVVRLWGKMHQTFQTLPFFIHLLVDRNCCETHKFPYNPRT